MLAVVYDPRYISWDQWASLMCEAYAGQNLQFPTAEDKWKEWAQGLIAIDIFVNEAIPDPRAYNDWRDWVAAVVGAVNQRTE